MPPQIEHNFPPINKPPASAPIQKSAPKKHTNLVLLTILMILVGILAVGCFMYQSWTPIGPMPSGFFDYLEKNQENQNLTTVDEFANWKTYRNEKYGFEFKYPKELTPTYTDDSGIVLNSNEKIKYVTEHPATEYSPNFVINAEENPNNFSVREFFDGNHGPELFDEYGRDKEIEINGYKAYLTNPIRSDGEFIVIPAKGYFITIYGVSADEQILSTFKFTK